MVKPRRADRLLVLAVLQDRAERAVDRRGVELLHPEQIERRKQSIASAIPGGFWTSLSRMRATASATCTASVSAAPRTRRLDLDLALRGRIVDPLVEAASATASCRSRVRLEVSTMAGRCVARIVPISGIVTAASASSSSRNASKSSSARSISSIKSTAGRGPGCFRGRAAAGGE